MLHILIPEFVPTNKVEKGCGRRLSTHRKVVTLTNSKNKNHHLDTSKLSLLFVLIPLTALDMILARVFRRILRPSFPSQLLKLWNWSQTSYSVVHVRHHQNPFVVLRSYNWFLILVYCRPLKKEAKNMFNESLIYMK